MKRSKKRLISLLTALMMVLSLAVPISANAADWAYPETPKTVDDKVATVAAHNAGISVPLFLGANLTTMSTPNGITGTDPAADFKTAQGNTLLAIFGTSMNKEADPYLWNYYYNLYAKANNKPVTDNNAVYTMPGFSPMAADVTRVEAFGNMPASIYLKPDVLLGINANGGVTYDDLLTEAKAQDAERYGDYNPKQVAFLCSNLGQMSSTMYNVAEAMKAQGKTGRYGDPVEVAKDYEEYIKGIQYYILSQIDAGKVEQKTVAIIDPTSSTEGGKFTAYTEGVASGTAAMCRGAEYLSYTTKNIVDEIGGLEQEDVGEGAMAYKLTPQQVAKADVIYITGHQGGEMTEDEFLNLMNDYGIKSADIPEVYATLPSMIYGIIMNAVEAGIGVGLFNGFAYSDIVNPVYADAFFQEKFYHINDAAALQNSITNTYEKTNATLPEGITTDLSNYSGADFQKKLDAGWDYYAAHKSEIDSKYERLIASENMGVVEKPEDPNQKIIDGVKATTIDHLKATANTGYNTISFQKSKGYKVDGYQVYRSRSGKTGSFGLNNTVTSTTYKDKISVTPGQKYYYKVRGVRKIDGKNYYTNWSDVKSVTAKTTGNPIKAGVEKTTLKAKSAATKGKMTISWTKSAGYKVDGYQVYRSRTGKTGSFGLLKSNVKTTKYTDSTVKKGTKYYYKVRGVRKVDGKNVYTKWSNVAYRVAK